MMNMPIDGDTTGSTKTHIQSLYLEIVEQTHSSGLQNPEWSWYVQFQRAAQIELWTGQKAPLDVMRKELKEIIREENEKAQTE